MTTPYLVQRQQVTMAVESSEGVEASLANSDIIAPVYDVEYVPNFELDEREARQSSLSNVPNISGGRSATVRFTTEIKGSGTATTPPPNLSVPFRACGLEEHILASQVSYSIDSAENAVSATIEVREGSSTTDVKIKKIIGARGNVKILASKGDIVVAQFEFLGVYVEPSDTTIMRTNDPGTTLPKPFLSASIQFFSNSSLQIDNIEFDLGNTLTMRDDVNTSTGVFCAVITSRNSVGRIDPESVLTSTENFFNDLTTNTPGNLYWKLDGGSGNTFEFDALSNNLLNIQESDRDGIRVLDIEHQVGSLSNITTFSNGGGEDTLTGRKSGNSRISGSYAGGPIVSEDTDIDNPYGIFTIPTDCDTIPGYDCSAMDSSGNLYFTYVTSSVYRVRSVGRFGTLRWDVAAPVLSGSGPNMCICEDQNMVIYSKGDYVIAYGLSMTDGSLQFTGTYGGCRNSNNSMYGFENQPYFTCMNKGLNFISTVDGSYVYRRNFSGQSGVNFRAVENAVMSFANKGTDIYYCTPTVGGVWLTNAQPVTHNQSNLMVVKNTSNGKYECYTVTTSPSQVWSKSTAELNCTAMTVNTGAIDAENGYLYLAKYSGNYHRIIRINLATGIPDNERQMPWTTNNDGPLLFTGNDNYVMFFHTHSLGGSGLSLSFACADMENNTILWSKQITINNYESEYTGMSNFWWGGFGRMWWHHNNYNVSYPDKAGLWRV